MPESVAWLLHADAVPKDRAAGVRAGRINGDDANGFSARAIVSGEFIDERAFARAGRAGDSDQISAAGEGKELAQQVFGARIGIFDRGDGARNRAAIARAYLRGPVGNAFFLRHSRLGL